MRITRITIDHSLLRIYFGFLGFSGAAIAVGHVYLFLTGQPSVQWYMPALFGTIMAVGGLLVVSGFYTPSLPDITLTKDEILLKRGGGYPLTTFRWDNLKSVELANKSITIQYAKTGLKNSMRIPFSFRFKKLDELESALAEACERKNITFIKHV